MLEMIGGPDRDRTGDLFHAMEARSQLRHRPTRRRDATLLLSLLLLDSSNHLRASAEGAILACKRATMRPAIMDVLGQPLPTSHFLLPTRCPADRLHNLRFARLRHILV